jgi:quinohemoprotein ethanol dehydrogenase
MIQLLRLLLVAALLPIAAVQAAEIDNAALSNDADGNDWAAFGRTFSEQRFSPLDQINKQSVSRLKLAWSLELDDVWNVSTAPVEVDGVIYFAAGFSVVHAVDVRSGKLLWKYDPHCDSKKMRMAWGSRGITYWKGKLYTGVQDGRLFALDAKTGTLVWETQTTEPGDNRYITGAPRVFNGKVIIGHGGADFGHVRGYVTAYDAETGKQDWRFYIVPGNPADGFEDKAMEMAAKTWKGEWWKYGGGGTAWNAMTYDPEFNRVYIGTGNGSPWNHKLRSPGGGDNLYLCSVVALDADTGEYLWHYQTTPGESWDFNSTMDIVLATMEIDGKPRKVLMHAPKNGFFYVIDRETGKLISAEKFGKVTWADHIDMATGRPVENPGVRYEDGEALIWPGSAGAHNWQPMSYSPDTKLVYIPSHELPGYYNDKGRDPKTWTMVPNDVMGLKGFFDDIPKNAGSSFLLAWDPIKQKKVWRSDTPGATNGGVLSTHGGLVFQGDADGDFKAHDANTGDVLWSAQMGVGTQAPPITYQVDGKQYVSVLAGWAGSQMLLGSLSAQHGWTGRDHPRRLLTYVLDGSATLPPSAPPNILKPVDDASIKLDADKVMQGRDLYQRCVICHGVSAIAGGFAPDLRASPVPLNAQAFKAIVQGGALEPRGMPKFDELSDQDLDSVRQYIRERARYKPSFWEQVTAAWDFITLMIKMKWLQLTG